MNPKLNLDKVARILGAERRGHVRATGGYFGAAELVAEVSRRFRSPGTGGRPTDPHWTEKRLVGLSPESLKELQDLAAVIRRRLHVQLDPMQAAAILLEKALRDLRDTGEFAKQVSDLEDY